MFKASFITLFPEAFPGPLGVSILERARKEGIWDLETVDLRPFGIGRHHNVDATPAGGGAGMVIRPDVAAAAIDSLPRDGRPLIYLSPRGIPFNQQLARTYAETPGLILFCGPLMKGWMKRGEPKAGEMIRRSPMGPTFVLGRAGEGGPPMGGLTPRPLVAPRLAGVLPPGIEKLPLTERKLLQSRGPCVEHPPKINHRVPDEEGNKRGRGYSPPKP